MDEVGSYIDFNTELPGPVCTTEDELISLFGSRLDGGCRMTDDELKVYERWFDFKDKENCSRTYHKILDYGF